MTDGTVVTEGIYPAALDLPIPIAWIISAAVVAAVVAVPVAVTISFIITIIVPIPIPIALTITVTVIISVSITLAVAIALSRLNGCVAFICLSGYNAAEVILFIRQSLAELTPIGRDGTIFKVFCKGAVITAFLGIQDLTGEVGIASLIISPSEIL